MSLTHLFVDMNSFFASCEQHWHKHLRYRPVAVAAVDCDNTCCIAASYEAKALGVRTGTLVREAKGRGVEVVVARPPYYACVHHKIRKAIETVLPVDDAPSIDEFSCRLSRPDREPSRAVEVARRVKRAIAWNVGAFFSSSVGLAPNRFLSKVASDMHKPDGLTCIAPDDLPHKLHTLQLTDFPGIGRNMLRRLHKHGIHTTQLLCAASEKELRAAWGGVLGSWWWHWLRGFDLNPKSTRKSSVGHSHVLPVELRNHPAAYAVLLRLTYKAAARLRTNNLWARRMEIYVSYSFHEEGWRAVLPLGLCQDTRTMTDALASVWPHHPAGIPTQVAVTLLDLVPHASATLPLFPDEDERLRLSRALDGVNKKFGSSAVYPATVHHVRTAAPTRIGFTHIPTLTDFANNG